MVRCKLCGKEFLPTYIDQEYCCDYCEKRAVRYYRKAQGNGYNVNYYKDKVFIMEINHGKD